MNGEEHPARVALREARERSIERLSDAFARDAIGLDEFERRVDLAYAIERPEDAEALLADLARPEANAPASSLARIEPGALAPRPPATSLAVAGARTRDARAIFGNLERSGRFVVEDGMRATAIFGNVELDLRDVVLPPGRTHVEVRAVFGNVELVVPPELPVECGGSGILGSFSSVHRVPTEGTDERAVLVVHGSAVLGNVEIRTLPRGRAR